MLRSSDRRSHVLPPASERNTAPSSASTMANTRSGWAPEAHTPILPSTPLGRFLLREISVQVSPPSGDFNKPLPGPPLVRPHGARLASQNDGYRTRGLV